MNLENFVELAEKYARLDPLLRATLRAAVKEEPAEGLLAGDVQEALRDLVAVSTDAEFDDCVDELLAGPDETEDEDDEDEDDSDDDEEEDDDSDDDDKA